MRRFSKLISVFLILCLVFALCSCDGERGEEEISAEVAESIRPTPVPGSSDVPGEEQLPLSTPTDGLEGSYYNDYLRMVLTLDGRGGCTLTGDGTDAFGTYIASGSDLVLDFGTRQETAVFDPDGDITISGRTGYFLRDWNFWGITEAEAGTRSIGFELQTGAIDNGDGTSRYRDFENGIAFTFPNSMRIVSDQLISAVAVTDDNGGCVSGRNVTELYATAGSSDDEFIEDYIKTFVFADFDLLYGSVLGFSAFTLLHEDIPGRLAAATLQLSCAESIISAKVILYTSTYADGTVNYICKTLFAPAEDSARIEAISAAVTDMGAVRLKEAA